MATEQTTPSGLKYTNYQADTPEAMKNEKRALLALMAEHGTEGQAEYQRSKEQSQAARAASIEMAAARGAQVHAPGTLAAELNQESDRVMRGLLDNQDQGMLGHGREMDRIAAANAAYLDQVAGASQLNRDLLDKQLAASGGGGRGGGGGSSGADYGASATGLSWSDFDSIAKAENLSPTETLAALQEMRKAGELTKEQWDAWGRASMNGMSIPGLNQQTAPTSGNAWQDLEDARTRRATAFGRDPERLYNTHPGTTTLSAVQQAAAARIAAAARAAAAKNNTRGGRRSTTYSTAGSTAARNSGRRQTR